MTSLALFPNCDSRVNSYCSTNEMMMVQQRSYDSPDHSPQRMDPRMASSGPVHVYSNHHHQQQTTTTDLVRCKRRIQLGHLPSPGRHSGPQSTAVARRNERERKRVKLVNEGFNTLRKHVPHSSKNKKMSKVDTLRSAVEYIRRLQELLGETATSQQGTFDENSSPVGQSSAGSPSPSMCSEASSPCDMFQGDEEAELMSWLF